MTYTAVITGEEGGSGFRYAVAVVDDGTWGRVGFFEFPDPAAPPDSPGVVEAAAERVLADNGWQVTESWSDGLRAMYAPAERI